MTTFSCYSIKGGVGKTALAVNLAYFLRESGKRTLLIDLDPQGAVGFYFRVAPPRDLSLVKMKELSGRWVRENLRESDFPGLDILPSCQAHRLLDVALAGMKKSRKQLKWVIEDLESDYDAVVIDCPPNLTLISENIFRASHAILVPVIPTPLSARTLEQLEKFLAAEEIASGVFQPFFSMIQGGKSLHRELINSLRARFPSFFASGIPFSTDIEKMGIHRKPLLAYSNGHAANKCRELCREILDRNL